MTTLREKIERNIEKRDCGHSSPCWCWTRAVHPPGYARIWTGSKQAHAHRVSYEIFVGPIGDGLVIDHLCRNRACVNPDHLEPVTNQENIRRAFVGPHYQKKSHCPKGHPYDSLNTYITPRGSYQCRACNARACAEMRQRRRLHAELDALEREEGR